MHKRFFLLTLTTLSTTTFGCSELPAAFSGTMPPVTEPPVAETESAAATSNKRRIDSSVEASAAESARPSHDEKHVRLSAPMPSVSDATSALPPSPTRLVRQKSSDVQDAIHTILGDERPEDVIVLFDFDETLVVPRDGGDVESPRDARSARILAYLELLRAKYPGRVFIYSAGNTFLFSTAVPAVAIDLPQVKAGNPLFNQASGYHEDHLTGLIASLRTSHDTATRKMFCFPGTPLWVTHYPDFSAFTIEVQHIRSSDLRFMYKAQILSPLVKLLGASAASPKKLVFVDDNTVCAENASDTIVELIEDGFLKPGSAVIHWPMG